MDDPHYGQVFLVAGPESRVQWLICAVTQSHAFHCGIGIGNGMVISAKPGGVSIEPESNYPGAVWSRFPLTDAQAHSAVEWVKAREGRRYSWFDDGVVGLEHLLGRSFPVWDRDRAYQCAMLADAALTHGAGYQVFSDGRRRGRVSPGSFARLFQHYGWQHWRYAAPTHLSAEGAGT